MTMTTTTNSISMMTMTMMTAATTKLENFVWRPAMVPSSMIQVGPYQVARLSTWYQVPVILGTQ